MTNKEAIFVQNEALKDLSHGSDTLALLLCTTRHSVLPRVFRKIIESYAQSISPSMLIYLASMELHEDIRRIL